MSIEFSAYSKDPTPIPIAALADAARSRGFSILVDRTPDGASGPQLVNDGDLRPGDVIWGWPTHSRHAAQITAALTTQDHRAITRFSDRGILGACPLEYIGPPDPPTDKDRANLLAAYGDEYLAYRDASQICYYTRTAAGRNDLSVDLQTCVMDCILQLRGGLLEDPQLGEYRIEDPSPILPLPPTPSRPADRPWWAFWKSTQ